jgi:hypothetical protein
MVEEVKGGKQPMKVRPKVGTMKATIVSMEYKNNKSDDFEKFKPLSESYGDAEKVVRLFEKTLEWSKNDVSHF